MRKASPHCFKLLTQLMRCAFFLADSQRGQQHGRKNGDDGYDDEQATRVKPE